MSTLTKILVVLLAFASIFLCGIVVTYVANADSFKQKVSELSTDKESLNKKVRELTQQVNEKADQKKQLEDKLSGEVASLNTEKSELKGKLENSEREKSALLAKVDSLTSITKEFYQTNDQQGQLLKNTLAELNKVQAEQVNDRKALSEAESAIAEKIAAIESLEAEKSTLLEQKAQLQDRLDQLMNPGRRTVKSVPVTPKKAPVPPAGQAPAAVTGIDVDLQGTITAVDLKNSMASISVGKAAGVKEGMKFHVTRGEEFICDIQIIDVEGAEAVGVLELVQKQPQIGDVVSTNL